MADEAVILNVNNLQYRQVTVADGSAFPKGSLLVLTADPNTADLHRGSTTQIPLGFCAVEKVANDGQTTLPVVVQGDVDAVADGAITLGDLVALGTAANRVRSFGAASIERLPQLMGRCMETASAAEVVRIRLFSLG